jgi:hypothetical protein
MQISGTGITTFDAKVKPDFNVETTYALQWAKLSSGNWRATDRGKDADIYEATNVRLYGTEDVIDNFINQVEANRVANSNVITLGSINDSEHIFGADVDYTYGVNATVIDIPHRIQATWKGWSIPLKLRLLSPIVFTGAPALPLFRFLNVGYDADAEYSINKFDSYNGSFSYADHRCDAGIFTGTFVFTDEEMIGLRSYMATTRGASFTMAYNIVGVTNMFGRRTTAFPIVKLKDLTEEKMYNRVGRWICKLTFVEDAIA